MAPSSIRNVGSDMNVNIASRGDNRPQLATESVRSRADNAQPLLEDTNDAESRLIFISQSLRCVKSRYENVSNNEMCQLN